MGERPGATLLGKTSRWEDSVGTTCYVSFHTPLLDIDQHRRVWSPPQDVFSQLLNVFKHNWYLINPVALSTDLRTFLSLYSQLPFRDFISGIFPLPRFESGTCFTLSLSSSFHPSRSFLSLFFCNSFSLLFFSGVLSFPSSLSSSPCTSTFFSVSCSFLLSATSPVDCN